MFPAKSRKEFFNFVLRDYCDYDFSVGCVVGRFGSEKLVDYGVHFLVGKLCAWSYGYVPCEREGYLSVHLVFDVGAVGYVVENVAQQFCGVNGLCARGNGVYGEAPVAEVGEVEAGGCYVIGRLAKHYLLPLRELYYFRKHYALLHTLTAGEPVAELFVEYAYVGALLVDEHEARLHGRYYVFFLVLVVF